MLLKLTAKGGKPVIVGLAQVVTIKESPEMGTLVNTPVGVIPVEESFSDVETMLGGFLERFHKPTETVSGPLSGDGQGPEGGAAATP